MALPQTPPKRPVVKAKFFRNELTSLIPTNVVEDTTADTALFRGTQALTPPYDPDECAAYLDMSSALRTNVDAYASNIDSYGHTFEPVIDLEDEAAIEVVRQAILEERLERRLASEGPDQLAKALVEVAHNGGGALEVSDAEVQQQIDELRILMAVERRRLEFFFDNCTVEGSFIHLRRITRQDYETLGNAYWEILRDGSGQPSQFNLIPGLQVRLTPRSQPVEVTKPANRSLLHQNTITQLRAFRQFIQVLRNNVRSSGNTAIGGQLVYFKEFGDPRMVSSASGEVYNTIEEMQKAEPGARPATEVVHWKIHSPMSPYGNPRWVSEMMNLLGTRHAQTVNYLYFENKSIPPLAILVSGGSLAPESVSEIRSFIDNEIKGARNFHKIMILEAQSDPVDAGAGGSVRVEIKPLTDAMIQDAMFLQYMEKNVDSLGNVFRNPRIVRGDTSDINRACYDEETETLTHRGWKKLGEFLPDDKVAAYDPDTQTMRYVIPESLHIYDVEEDLYHFKNQSLDVMVTGNHKMLVKSGHRPKRGQFSVHAAGSIPWLKTVLKTTVESVDGPELAVFALPKDPLCQIERGHDHSARLDGDTFLEFLGYWLSEGSLLSTDSPQAPYCVTLSQKSGPKADKIRVCLDKTGWRYNEQYHEATGMHRWWINNRCLSAWLRSECGHNCYTKRVPDLAKGLCSRQSRILFDALMLGDGHWSPRVNQTNGYYPSVSKQLCDDVQSVAVALGYRANLGVHYDAFGNRGKCWRVYLSKKGDTQILRPPAKVPYKGKVYCFSVPGYGFFVTRRNGKVAVQGNTSEAAIRLAEQQVYQPERNEFDWRINHEILPQLGIRFWKFVSRGPDMTDPQELAKMLDGTAEGGMLTFAELRRIAEKVYGITLPVLSHWTNNIPMRVFRSHQESLRFGGVSGLPTGEIPVDPNKEAALELKAKEIESPDAGVLISGKNKKSPPPEPEEPNSERPR